MSSGLNNIQTYFDECCSINSNFDSHVATPSLSYKSHSVTKHTPQYMQNSKMPGLLRLDSVGEVSVTKIPADNYAANRTNSKPILRNCKSVDYDFFRANKFLPKSNMASVKSLAHNYDKFHGGGQRMSEPIFSTAHSFSHPQGGYTTHKFSPLKNTQNLSLDLFSQGTVGVLDKMLSALAPAGKNGCRKLCDSLNHHNCMSAGTLQTPISTYVGSVHEKTAMPAVAFTSSPNILSTIAAVYTTSMQSSHSCSAPDQQLKLLVTEANDCPFIATAELPITKVNMDDSINQAQTKLTENTSSKLPSDHSDLHVAFENVIQEGQLSALESSPGSECLQRSCDSLSSEEHSENSDIMKHDNDKKYSCDDTPNSSNKSVIDLSSVLSAPRKTVKKGRPSSKKQKKRQRQKRKHESSGESSSYSHVMDENDQLIPECPKITCSQLENVDSSSSLGTFNSQPQNSPLASSPVKIQSNWCPIANFFSRFSDFDETDDEDDNSEGSDEWSGDEDENVHISPIRCRGFNFALNLDVIFKKKSIPSLKSVLNADDSESDSETPSSTASSNHPQSVCTFTDDSLGDTSVDLCVPSAASDLSPFGLTTGLSVESLITKKPCVYSQAEIQPNTFDIVDGLEPSDNDHPLSNSLETCLEALSQVNAKWDQDYPTAGFRSCQSVSGDEIKDSSIKVHFATGSNLLTVHIVGTEERGGTWHHFALDRERFQRRILDLETVISPVFEINHRSKILDRNHQCKNNNEIQIM